MSDLTMTANTTPAQPYDFNALIAAVRQRIEAGLETQCFQVQVPNLQDVFLSGLLHERQDHTCATCRSFFRQFGGLVHINPETGKRTSIAWDETSVPEEYKNAVRLLRLTVEEAAVRDVFYHEAGLHGDPVTEGHPDFTHFHFEAVSGRYRPQKVGPLNQHVAAAREAYKPLATTIGEFSMSLLQDAQSLFASDPLLAADTKHALTLNEYVVFRQRLQNVQDRKDRAALIWYMVGTSYESVVHIRGSALGEFLFDLRDADYEKAKKGFLKYTRGATYQRPQAGPKLQEIEVAEKRINDLGLASALERRYADVQDIPEWVWQPNQVFGSAKDAATSVFGHLKQQADQRAQQTRVNGGTITFTKFLRQVLPTAQRLELLFSQHHKYAFTGFTTAVHPDAEPLLMWDKNDGSVPRNPVSTYQYVGGTQPAHWGLGNRVPVVGITRSPHEWHEQSHPGRPKSYLMVLETGKDGQNSGLGLFPEVLRKELYDVRATIEAYSNRAKLANPELSTVSIGAVEGAPSIGITVDVTVGNIVTMYNIDRWD